MATSTIYNQSFWNAMRGQLSEYANMTENEDGYGGHIAPDTFTEQFTAALAKENLFRRFATVLSFTASSGKIQAVSSTGEAAWVPESVAIPDSADTFTQFPLHFFKLTALTRLKESFVSDYNFNIENYLQNEFARRFGRAEEEAFIIGDGVNQPTGILASGETGVTAADSAAPTFDEVVKLYFSLKSIYRKNAAWIMSDETAMHLRTLKDSAGNYLWRDSDDTIFSKPVLTSPFMPTVSAGAKVIAFGDLSHYWVVERQPLTVKRLSELYSLESQIGFSAYERLDGRLILPEAVKILKMAE